jgi:PASTA domain
LHPFPASRAGPPILTSVGAVVLALLVSAVMPGSARAACASSVATGNVFFEDLPLPVNEPGAPDIGRVNNVLDAGCGVDIEVQLAQLQPDQYLIVQFDLDESTGDPTTELIDAEVYLDANGAVLDDFVNPPALLPTFGQYGFTVSLDQLGVTRSPSQLGVAVVAAFDPTPQDPTNGDDVYGDYAPNLDQVMHRVPVTFSQPALPPPPPPPSAPAAAPPPPATTQAKGCKVPKIKGLTVKKAKAKLKSAGCKYKLKGKGRVRSVSPKAGTRTSATVRVKARPKKRKKRAPRAGLARAAQLR